MKAPIRGLFLIPVLALSLSCATAGKEVLGDGRTVYQKADTAALHKKETIEGLVLDASTKKGIRGAVVEIKNANLGMGYYRLETDSKGRFSIDDFIKHVRYNIEVTAEGYVPYVHAETVRAGSYTVMLRQEGILSGEVKDSSGMPVAGAEVKLTSGDEYYEEGDEGYAKRPEIALSDPQGRYQFTRLKEGSYAVAFSKQGYISETARIQAIKSGERFHLPMLLFRPASVSGAVRIHGIDSPAINMEVTLSGKTTHATATYQDGSYLVEDIKPGRYKLVLTHQGFYRLESSVLAIREGETLKNVNFTVKPKDPQLQAYAFRYTFAPGSKVEFNLKTFRLEKVKTRLYRVPMDVLLRGRAEPVGMNPAKEGFQRILEREEPIKNFQPYEWRYQSLEISEPLPGGGYCIEVSGPGSALDRKFFTVTSVGVVAKRSRESVFAYVTSLVHSAPVAGASIIVFDNTPVKKEHRNSTSPYKPPQRIEDLPVKIVHRGMTGPDGIYHHAIKNSMHLSVLALGPDGSYAFCSTGSPQAFAREESKFFIYTDRPVYRAGDTVHYKIVAKKRERRFSPMAPGRLHYAVRNIDMDEVVDEGALQLDEWGTSSASLKLGDNTTLGEYEIRTGTDKENLYGAGRFYVEQYRKPEFKIDITPSRDYFTNNDTVEFKVEARYFFGAALKGALLRYRFYETRLRETDTTYWWEEDYGSAEYYSRIRLEGDKYLDDNGVASLKLQSGSYPYDREVALEATVVDQSNVSITSRASVTVGRGEYYIKINPAANFFADDETKKVLVRTVAHNGDPVSVPLAVKVYRYVWKPWQRVYVHEARPILEKTVNTDRKGSGQFELPKKFDVFGEFDIVAEAKDRRDNVITASRVVWIYSRAGARIESRFKNLEISLSETELDKPGEVTCLIKSRFADAYVCLTLEGRDIYDKKVVRMTGNVLPVKLAIKSEYAPNLYVTATMQRRTALFTSSLGVSLPGPDTALSLTLVPDREKYRPGEKATVSIKAADQRGQPVRADLSLGAVDEAIYQIRPDHTPKIRDFFYSKISNWVLTGYSYPITILAGAGKEGKVKIREKFEDTAFWKADIRTDEKGRATVQFTLPDNLTTWRLTARGHDREGRMGEKRGEILVTQDLIARIGKPRFLVEGDGVSLIGIVNSNTPRGLPAVSTEFRVDQLEVPPDEKVKISLPAFGSARSYYTVKVPEGAARSALLFTAIGDGEARDAVKATLPVHRRGVPYRLYGMGDMAFNQVVEIKPLGDTDDFTFVPEELILSVNPSPVFQMLKASRFLAEYPYGCVEQVINRFLPNLAFKKLLERKGMGGLAVDEKLDEKITAGLENLGNAQNSDGTWGWWYGDRGNEFITGYALYALHVTGRLGREVDREAVKNGLAAVERVLGNPTVSNGDERAYLLYIHALWGRWNDGAFRRLSEAKNHTAYQLAFLARAGILASRNKSLAREVREAAEKTAGACISGLKSLQGKDSRGIYWQSAGATEWSWQGGVTEMTAHVLAALTEAGDRSPLPAQIAASLSRRMRGEAWNSTKETASVFFAFCAYLESMEGTPSSSGTIDFDLDGRNIASVAYDAGTLKNPAALTKRIKLEGGSAPALYRLKASGSAGPDASFTATLAGTLKFKEKGILSLVKSEERSIKQLENGMSLARRFYSVTRVRDMHNSEYMVPQDISDRKQFRVGDEFLVKIRLLAQDDFEYLVLEDYLPSGFEVVLKNAYDEYQPYAHSEAWDNRMVFFFTRLNKGEVYEIGYIMRAELPGEFIVKPSRMECMYEPSIQGWSVPASFRVEKK